MIFSLSVAQASIYFPLPFCVEISFFSPCCLGRPGVCLSGLSFSSLIATRGSSRLLPVFFPSSFPDELILSPPCFLFSTTTSPSSPAAHWSVFVELAFFQVKFCQLFTLSLHLFFLSTDVCFWCETTSAFEFYSDLLLSRPCRRTGCWLFCSTMAVHARGSLSFCNPLRALLFLGPPCLLDRRLLLNGLRAIFLFPGQAARIMDNACKSSCGFFVSFFHLGESAV